MQLTVKGKQLDVGDALRTHVADSLNTTVGKYFNKPIEANVVLTRNAHLFKADIQVHVGRGIMLQSASEATEPYPAFDTACEKLGKRLRRYKRRLKSHASGAKAELPAESFPSFVIDASNEEELADDAQPIIIAEGTTTVPSLSVVDAVMHMDLENSTFKVFRNGTTGGLNLVYRRDDGHIGWIDASRDPQTS